MAQKNIVIIGAGYAGIIAANRLARKSPDTKITLITANPVFAEKIRNHQVIAGTKQKTHTISKMVHKTVDLVFAKVEKILPKENLIRLEDGRSISYDFLGYTPGMKGAGLGLQMEGYYSVANEAECIRLRKLLLENPSAKITVLGAGLSGIETATELAENYPNAKITLLDSGSIGKAFHPNATAYMKKVLSNAKIKVLEGKRAETFQEDRIITEEGELIFHDVCIISAGLVASDLGKGSGLAHNGIGQVFVNEYMQVPEYNNILGAGDAVNILGDEYSYVRMSCATALPMGIYMAERMAALLGVPSKIGTRPLSFGYLIRCVSLGRKEGLVQSLHPDDSPKDKMKTGRLGAFIKEFICSFTVFSCKVEKYFDFYKWPELDRPSVSTERKVLVTAGK